MDLKAQNKPILITGGDTAIGMSIAMALINEGATVTLIIREGGEEKLGKLASQARWTVGDLWDGASLRGKARGHGAVIHTIGSMREDHSRGLNFNRLNFVSARNAANMCVSDGVPHFALLSAAWAPWLNPQYLQSKREAEAYVRKIGLKTSIIRAPLVFERGASRPIFFRLASLIGAIPILNWFAPGKQAPMPLDVLARGVARLALQPIQQTKIYYARDLRRLNQTAELRGDEPLIQADAVPQEDILPFETVYPQKFSDRSYPHQE